MEQTKKKKDDEHQINIDLGLGGLFKGLGNLVDLVSELSEKGQIIKERTQEFNGEGPLKDLKGVYGFSIKMGTGGKPEVQSFGNVKKSDHGPIVDEVREPMTDIFEEAHEIQVIAEMPGIEEKDVKLDLNEDVLTIDANHAKRKYHKELLLPAKVKVESLSYVFKNGILEIKINK
ncbi:MAG: archaeal heat shock protein Hsp20 [Candidatus Zhuqueibacterota bacterium]